MTFAALVPIRNRPGWFAVLSPEAAETISRGYMKLFCTHGKIEVETVTRTRKSLSTVDSGFRVVFLAVDQHGNIVTDIA